MIRSGREQVVGGRPTVGGVHTLREDDYRFGKGSRIVIVDAILRDVIFDNGPWWKVRVRWKPALSFGLSPWRAPREIYIRTDAFHPREA